jgi:hypothetical protein
MLGVEGLLELAGSYCASHAPLSALPQWLVEQAVGLSGEPLADDVAMLLLTEVDPR